MPDIRDNGGALMQTHLSNQKRVMDAKKPSEKALSSGEMTDVAQDPIAATRGQNAKAKIAAHTTASQQTLEAITLLDSINSALSSGIELLNEQVELATLANTDTSGPKIKNLYDNSLQNALQAFDITMRSVRWNSAKVLASGLNNVTELTSRGIYNPGVSDVTAFNFGGTSGNVESFYDLTGTATGAVGAIGVTGGTSVSVNIGGQTFLGDAAAFGANGGILTLTDGSGNNHIRFKIANAGETPANIAGDINNLLNGMTFTPNISNLNSVNNFFTGGVNYNFTRGNYTGIASSVTVENLGNQLKVTVKLTQSGDQDQYFTATIPQNAPSETLILNSQTNSQNTIAFNFSDTLATPLNAQTLETALHNLLGISGVPATFSGMAVDPYQGITINASNAVDSGTYALEYSLVSSSKAQLLLNFGDKHYVQELDLPLRDQDIISFSNGVTVKLTDVALFDEITPKAQMLFTVNRGAGGNVLYFQTGINVGDQDQIYPPTATIEALGLLGINLKNNTNAAIAGEALREAVRVLSAEFGRMAEAAKTLKLKRSYAEEAVENSEEIRADKVGTDNVRELINVTGLEAQSDIIQTSLIKLLQEQKKRLEILNSRT